MVIFIPFTGANVIKLVKNIYLEEQIRCKSQVDSIFYHKLV
jgi:hypothetical protein